ncbi:hypothetical protein SEVIR_1G162901v4 [Setaria viridis]|uniref:Uncharacterized protein n=1 Tax=Setaria viridis TaxID=4556 RepID=A0A4U6WBK6_SETVI|nr:hypothetical protein SEVIR_1G162901v2 [Setaria viridis]
MCGSGGARQRSCSGRALQRWVMGMVQPQRQLRVTGKAWQRRREGSAPARLLHHGCVFLCLTDPSFLHRRELSSRDKDLQTQGCLPVCTLRCLNLKGKEVLALQFLFLLNYVAICCTVSLIMYP